MKWLLKHNLAFFCLHDCRLMYFNYLTLLKFFCYRRIQHELEVSTKQAIFVDSSISDTIRTCIVLGNHRAAVKVKTEFKVCKPRRGLICHWYVLWFKKKEEKELNVEGWWNKMYSAYPIDYDLQCVLSVIVHCNYHSTLLLLYQGIREAVVLVKSICIGNNQRLGCSGEIFKREEATNW